MLGARVASSSTMTLLVRRQCPRLWQRLGALLLPVSLRGVLVRQLPQIVAALRHPAAACALASGMRRGICCVAMDQAVHMPHCGLQCSGGVAEAMASGRGAAWCISAPAGKHAACAFAPARCVLTHAHMAVCSKDITIPMMVQGNVSWLHSTSPASGVKVTPLTVGNLSQGQGGDCWLVVSQCTRRD